ncbi:MAG TPA: hypothetical protein VFG43_10465 [Geminicoccaceae bacterium]|nr:hypothetical protein [Geminicoccaceae bacterium]
MEDTTATARLPGLDIEIRHRQDPEEGQELVAITLRATPDLDTALGAFDPRRLVGLWLALNPWLAFNPWLRGLLPASRSIEPPAERKRLAAE